MRRLLLHRLSRCFHQYSRCHLFQMSSPIYHLVYELRRRLARYSCKSPFPAAPSLTKRDRFRVTSLSSSPACHLAAPSDRQCHSGSPHHAYRMAIAYRPPVPLRASRQPSRPPCWIVTSTTSMG